MTKRTIQWYSSSRLLPLPQRIGKEAYYDRHTIYSYLRVIEILNRKFGLLLSEIHAVIRKADALDDMHGLICVDMDDGGEPILEYPVVALSSLLEEFLEYEDNEASQCDGSIDGPNFSQEQMQRLDALSSAIVNGLRGSKKDVGQLITGGILALERKLFPKGKVIPQRPDPSGFQEVPF